MRSLLLCLLLLLVLSSDGFRSNRSMIINLNQTHLQNQTSGPFLQHILNLNQTGLLNMTTGNFSQQLQQFQNEINYINNMTSGNLFLWHLNLACLNMSNIYSLNFKYVIFLVLIKLIWVTVSKLFKYPWKIITEIVFRTCLSTCLMKNMVILNFQSSNFVKIGHVWI